jgi:hypothetical protein
VTDELWQFVRRFRFRVALELSVTEDTDAIPERSLHPVVSLQRAEDVMSHLALLYSITATVSSHAALQWPHPALKCLQRRLLGRRLLCCHTQRHYLHRHLEYQQFNWQLVSCFPYVPDATGIAEFLGLKTLAIDELTIQTCIGNL